jgi:hypothetical protein
MLSQVMGWAQEESEGAADLFPKLGFAEGKPAPETDEAARN